ncbi:MAG: DUF5666 domain-containing protein [Candidatus Sulfotelmatobacter sp.]
MKLVLTNYMKFCRKVVVGLIVLTSLAYAQASSEPSTSSIVSPKKDGTDASANIEPVKPSVTPESTDDSISVDPSSLLPDLPPVPRANATLIGGMVERLDRVRDRVVVHVFGGGQMMIFFDPRTVVYRAGKEATVAELQQGERIYLDTILDGDKVFARAIRLTAPRATGESQGVILKYRANRNELLLRDSISPTPVQVKLTSATQIKQGDRTLPISTLVPGTLVTIRFAPDGNGHSTASQVSILALPGTEYTFAGEVVHLDLSTGLVVLKSSTDNQTYEVYLSPSVTPDENLHPGSVVTVLTYFDGSRYLARNLTVRSQ